jgi:hypothetical protein
MPAYIYRLGHDGYVEWSTVVDAPISGIMTQLEMEEYLYQKYGNPDRDYEELDRRKIGERLERANRWGSSEIRMPPVRRTPEDLVAYNRAGPGETCLSYDQLLVRLLLARAPEDGP